MQKKLQQVTKVVINNNAVINVCISLQCCIGSTVDSVTTSDVLELNIDIQSPKILIPKSPILDTDGYLLLDCGNFKLTGYVGTTGTDFDAIIQVL